MVTTEKVIDCIHDGFPWFEGLFSKGRRREFIGEARKDRKGDGPQRNSGLILRSMTVNDWSPTKEEEA